MLHFLPRLLSLIMGLLLLILLLIPQFLWADEKGILASVMSRFSVTAFADDGAADRVRDPNFMLQYQFLNTPQTLGAVHGAVRLSAGGIAPGILHQDPAPRVEFLFRF